MRCQLTALDSLGLRVHEPGGRIFVAQAATSIEQLKELAGQLSARLTYLLEPISPIEIDADGCLVQMRSNPPQKEEDRRATTSCWFRATASLSLCRYARERGSTRAVVAAQVTREVLLRLVGDFSAAAADELRL